MTSDFTQAAPLRCFIYCLFLAMLTACSKPTIQKLAGPVQGTTYHISYWVEVPVDDKAIKAGIENEFAAIDKLLSNYRPDSVIETFNSVENTTSQEVGGEIVSLVKIAQVVNQASQGCYDLTIKPLLATIGKTFLSRATSFVANTAMRTEGMSFI